MDRIKGPWSSNEDNLLQELVQMLGPRNWSLISKSIPGRSGKSCRLRWCNRHPKFTTVPSPPKKTRPSFVRILGEERQLLKRAVSAEQYRSPGSPSGSGVSDSNVPDLLYSSLYNPTETTRGVKIDFDVNAIPAGFEAAASCNDPTTSLSLSLTGPESCEVSTHPVTESTQKIKEGKDEGEMRRFITEFMALVQEMIRVEVRNYMVQMQEQKGAVYGGGMGCV
ncbi:hypothetical protein F3Y22_tig00110435pilonHSYRG00111 [Hibiscus syriacus]|uniref:Uncharacterized protein n=1 Tax=Hibiscus syriacus TaxID=106335 RepID=A0A6A3APQ9_HIBSY|nr:hypothetical protein F3Y22_tig00110435pilonHSYRG00111 [Hibiscus syriacus]